MAYYKPGMTEAEQRALSATLPAATRADLLAKGKAALPSCRSAELQDCVQDKPAPGLDCQTINDGWIGDFDAMEAAYVALPLCPEPPSRGKVAGVLAVVALLGIGFGWAARAA